MRIKLKTLDRYYGAQQIDPAVAKLNHIDPECDESDMYVLPMSVLRKNCWGEKTFQSFRRRKRDRAAIGLYFGIADLSLMIMNKPTNSIRLTTFLYN